MPALATGQTTGTETSHQSQVFKSGPVIQNTPVPPSYATAGNQTYTTSDILGTVIVRNPNGANRVDVLPTAALMVAAIPQCRVGDAVDCLIINGAAATNTVQITAGTGGSLDPNQTAGSATIAAATSRYISIRITNATKGSEAYVFYC
jgi:hypothetical protein